ncbi:hypothetical protein D1006_35060 [Burkholderia stabilis]|uniref:Uncharacterized protein n=1 Tax=Burkholderia stabilis TaxID=95485 RepID=A0A4Q2A8D1_9BURK|nr:hypothetical protein [Burkholderia stabilis]RXV65325.1 hypothetical protein D1006_35060 [Burkholderia stabilis]
MIGHYQTTDELVRWFAQEPRTLGWDAFMALDQSKTNLLLQQEYIERFGGNDYIAPISDISPLTGAIQQLVGYRFDKPRVSFENASLRDGKVKMTLRAVSGSYLKWEGDASVARLTEITQVDPLAGHTFTSTIELRDDRLALDKLEVVLDLKDGKEPTLTTTRYELEQELTGAFIQARFAAMAREQTRFALSQLSYHDGDLIRPEKIKILSQAAPDEKHGDGAVLVFVKMVGGSEGAIPGDGASWNYMLNPSTHSALLVLGHDFMLTQTGRRGVDSLQQRLGNTFYPAGAKLELIEKADGRFKFFEFKPRIKAEYDAGRETPDENFKSWRFQMYLYYNSETAEEGDHGGHMTLLRIRDHSFAIEVAQYMFTGGVRRPTSNMFCWGVFHNGNSYGRSISIEENGSLLWLYKPKISGNRINFALDPTRKPVVKWPLGDLSDETQEFVTYVETHCQKALDDYMDIHMNSFLGPLQDFSTVHLSNLLFSSEVPLHLKDVKIPGDMLIFGDINPELTTFTLTEPEVSLIAGGTYTFKWSGSTTPTFTLEWADGSGELGSFNGATYTAPRTLPAGRTFVRVRVKARAGSATSYALVTVGARPVSVNPLVQLSMTGASAKPLLTAGAFDGAAVTFTSSKGGSFVVKDNGQAEYTASSFTGPVLIDTITATSGSQKAECTVVTYTQNHYNMVVMRDGSDFDAGKVLLSKDGGTFEVAPQALTWAVLEGDGSVEATDVATKFIFNAGAPSVAGFYLLQLEGGDDFGKNYSYVLLPGDLSLLKTPLA